VRKLAQKQIGLATIDRDQFRKREMRSERRLLGVFPRRDLVKIAWEPVLFASGGLDQFPGRNRARCPAESWSPSTIFMRVMNS